MIKNYNSVDVYQCREYIEINASNYIDRLLTSQCWNETFKYITPAKSLSPMAEDSFTKVIDTTHNSIKGSATHRNLEKKMGFCY